MRAFDANELWMQAAVTLRQTGDVPRGDGRRRVLAAGSAGHPRGHARPGAVQRGASEDYAFVNEEVDKKRLGAIVNDLAERYHKIQVAATLDALKETGFYWATRSGVTVSVEDIATPARSSRSSRRYEAKAEKVEHNSSAGDLQR